MNLEICLSRAQSDDFRLKNVLTEGVIQSNCIYYSSVF